MGTLYDAEDGRALFARVYRTTNAWERMRGLLGRAPLDADEGLILDPCGSIHTLFMSYPIDVVYLRRDLSVTRVIEGLPAWRLSIGRHSGGCLRIHIIGAHHRPCACDGAERHRTAAVADR